MADLETSLRWLSERGDLVGADELIERIEADLAGDPQVVVNKRRERIFMTKTQQSPITRPTSRYRGPAWAVAAFIAVLVVGVLYLAGLTEEDPMADSTPPTTVAPAAETMTDLEIIEAGMAAAYSGDAERAVELFELKDLDDEHIRRLMAFEAAVGGRVNLDCEEQDTPGYFACNWSYQNALTDAIGFVPASEDSSHVVVDEEGVITEFETFMTGPTWLRVAVGYFLNEQSENGLITPEVVGPDTECYWAAHVECAEFMVNHLDEWATWADANLPIEGFELP